MPRASRWPPTASSTSTSRRCQRVVDWAYPYGGYSYSTVQLVRKAGYYWSGITTRAGGWHDVQQMPLMPRVRVDGRESLAQFAASLNPN